VNFSEDMLRYMRWGRGVDLRRLTDEMGFTPERTTEQVIEAVARGHGQAKEDG
jgi:hypothetical protein